MDTKLWNNLIKGRKYEEEVAQYFESIGFEVWRLGNWKLPFDLFIWGDEREFWVEVKFRANGVTPLMGERLLLPTFDIALTGFLIAIHPTSSEVVRYVADTQKKIGFSFKSLKLNYKEVNWNEISLHQE